MASAGNAAWFVQGPPRALELRPGGIPDELTARPQWCGWAYSRSDKGKWTKAPRNPRTGRLAATDDPSTWGTFDECLAAVQRFDWDGLGYVIGDDDPYTVFDVDHVRDAATGELLPWAATLVDRLNTFADVSPSGTGVKLVLRGKLPKGRRVRKDVPGGGAIEAYDRRRFFALTGHGLNDEAEPSPIADGSVGGLLADVHEEYLEHPAWLPPRSGRPTNGAAPPPPPSASDEELLARMFASRRGEKIRRLWDGDVSDYPSASEADLGLCDYLRFWCGPDARRIDTLFRQSRLMRPKWDSRRGETTYGAWTVQKCLDSTEYVQPRQDAPQATFGVEGGAGAAPPPDGPLDGYEVIRRYFLAHYRPAFRRGTVLYSAALGREVKMGEALAGAPKALIDQLARATNAPRDKDGPKVNALPQFFNTWARSAWVDVLNALPDEDAAPVDEMAAEEFRDLLTRAMLEQITLGEVLDQGGPVHAQRRSLIDWCWQMARPGLWRQVRSLCCWCRVEERPDGEVRLWVAIRHELLTQIRADRRLESMPPKTFTRRAARYGLGTNSESDRPHGLRALVLDREFINSLTTAPSIDIEGSR